MISLAPIIAAAPDGAIIDLLPGEYDDALPLLVTKDIAFRGGRDTIIHSEWMVRGATLCLDGVTLEGNKPGGPCVTGKFYPFPQNGLITVRNGGILNTDDCEVRCTAGYPKQAIWLCKGQAQMRTVKQFSRIDWHLSPEPVLQVLYGSEFNSFSLNPDPDTTHNIFSGSSTYAVIVTEDSAFHMSGSHMYNGGPSSAVGVVAFRNSYAQIGASGKAASIKKPGEGFGFGCTIQLDASSTKLIGTEPGTSA